MRGRILVLFLKRDYIIFAQKMEGEEAILGFDRNDFCDFSVTNVVIR